MVFTKGHKFHKGGEKGWFEKGHIPPMINLRRVAICPICKNEFKTTVFGIEHNRKYCSKKCYNASKIGKGNQNWKGGIIIRSKIRHGELQKRYYQRVPGHPRANKYSPYVKIAVLNMEKSVGRYLLSNEIVHHINGNTLDDRIENLMLLQSNKEHRQLHKKSA